MKRTSELFSGIRANKKEDIIKSHRQALNKNYFWLFLFTIFISSAVSPAIQAQTEQEPDGKLVKIWEASGFDTPESILLSSVNKTLYVSNIGGQNSTERDGNGFISKLKSDGSVVEMKWAVGLNAPKGMAIYDETLYVTDIDKLVRISLKTGQIVESIPIDGAKFLNDIVITEKGAIVFSDSRASTFYKLDDNVLKKFICDTSFRSPNGLCIDGNKIIAGVGNSLISFTTEDSNWSEYILETGGVDGLSKVKEGVYIISDWSGKVHLVYSDKPKELILDTSLDKINAADFYYDIKTNLLFVPTFYHNTVSCYKLDLF
jgi:DNA-binding beta-propeller fold protein YncE